MPAARPTPPQGKPWRAHKSRVVIPRAGTLVQQERNFIYDVTGVMCGVRLRKNLSCRKLSMWGNADNFECATQLTYALMEEKLRIDVCKCMDLQNNFNKRGNQKKIKMQNK